MIGDLARESLAANLAQKPTLARVLVSLDTTPIKAGELPSETNKIRQSNLQFYLAYIPLQAKRGADKPYMISSDLFLPKNAIRFSTLEQLRQMSETDERVEFMLKYVKITEHDLETVSRLVRFHMPMYFDREKYERDVRKKAEELGIKIKGTVYSNEDMEDETVISNAIYLEMSRIKGLEGKRKSRGNK